MSRAYRAASVDTDLMETCRLHPALTATPRKSTPGPIGIKGKMNLVRRKWRNQLVGDPSKFTENLSHYTTPSHKVPYIISLITNEIENRSDINGIYAYAADEDDVRRFKKQLKKGSDVKVDVVDSHVLASALLSILGDLYHALIPHRLWREMILAGAKGPMEARVPHLTRLVKELSPLSKATVIHLIGHFNRIINNPASGLGEWDIAYIFGPILVGFSLPSETGDKDELELINETMRALLHIPEFYDQYDSEIYYRNCSRDALVLVGNLTKGFDFQ